MIVDGATMTVQPTECAESVSSDGLYDVVITEVGTQKINVIKAVRGFSGLGLAEAKNLVESVDGIVLSGVVLNVAESAKTDLEAAGATVTLNEVP